MSILGLTDKTASFPKIGTLRKGAKKPNDRQPGTDLKFFRFVSEDLAAIDAMIDAYGAEPNHISIRMPFATTEENFSAWREDWVASSLKHRCNGELCVLRLMKDGTYSAEPAPCPGGCKPTGRLKVVVPALNRLVYVEVTTTSIWDIINIHENLAALEMLRGSLRGIPLILRRRDREISTPEVKDGKRTGRRLRRKKSLITIEAAPEWVKLQLAAEGQAALPSVAQPLQLQPAQEEDVASNQTVDAGLDFGEPVDEDEEYESEVPEEQQINALLLANCNKQKGDRNGAGQKFFDVLYGEKTLDQKRAIARSLGLVETAAAKAEPVTVDAEVIVETAQPDDRAFLLADIEDLFAALKEHYKRTDKQIANEIARQFDGEIEIEQFDVEMLAKLKEGLTLWIQQLRKS